MITEAGGGNFSFRLDKHSFRIVTVKTDDIVKNVDAQQYSSGAMDSTRVRATAFARPLQAAAAPNFAGFTTHPLASTSPSLAADGAFGALCENAAFFGTPSPVLWREPSAV